MLPMVPKVKFNFVINSNKSSINKKSSLLKLLINFFLSFWVSIRPSRWSLNLLIFIHYLILNKAFS